MKKHILPKELHERGRALFEPVMADGETPRCQALVKNRLFVLSGRMMEGHVVTDADLQNCQCQKSVVPNKRVCGWHGAGFAKRGDRQGGTVAKHGRYSEFLKKTDFLRAYQDALDDPDLISHRDEMALVVSRIGQILRDWSDDPPSMDELGDVITSLGHALASQDIEFMGQEYLRLCEIVNKTKGQWVVWREVRALIDTHRKLSIAEINRLEKLQQFLTIQQILTLQAATLDTIKRVSIVVLNDFFESDPTVVSNLIKQLHSGYADGLRQLMGKNQSQVIEGEVEPV